MEKNKKIIAGIAGAVALIAIVAVCIFAFGSGKEKKITENKETTTVAETTTVPETTAQPKGISMLTGEHISEKLAEKDLLQLCTIILLMPFHIQVLIMQGLYMKHLLREA